jgi:hypothetical protein
VALYPNNLPDYFDKTALYGDVINQRVTKAKNGYLKVLPQLLKNKG